MKVIIIDTKTGGLDPARHGLTQVAAIDGTLTANESGVVTFATVHTFHSKLSALKGKEYDDEALVYQGITRESLTHGDNICASLTALASFVEPTYRLGPGRVWAQEDTFDHSFLRYAYAYESVVGNNDPRIRAWLSKRPDWNCSKRLARFCISLGVIPDVGDSLNKLSAHFAIERPTCFGDCKPLQDCMMTGKVIASLMTKLGFGQNAYFLNR